MLPASPCAGGYLRREDDQSTRGTRPRQFYPVFVDPKSLRIIDVGDPIAPDVAIDSVDVPDGLVAVFPVRQDGKEMEWGLTGGALMSAVKEGFVRATPGHAQQPFIISYLTRPNIKKLQAGQLLVSGTREDGSKIVVNRTGKASRPKTVWRETRHSAGDYGTKMLGGLIPGRRFPFPKSLYVVEDTLRLFVGENQRAVVVDFFSGSGTTAHAVMRLNRQDGGQRQSISVTNNEVSADEETRLRQQGHRPGDGVWEALGIFEYFTKPRIEAAVTGRTPDGDPVKGDYRFTDEFPIADGFDENVECFMMTYEALRPVAHNRSFEAIAPLLWLKAGAKGKRIDKAKDDFDVVDTYGILFDLDASHEFVSAISEMESVRMAFIVTDDDRGFQMVCAELSARVEGVRLYSSYLTNFTINTGRE